MNVAANEFVNLAKATVRNIDYLPHLITGSCVLRNTSLAADP